MTALKNEMDLTQIRYSMVWEDELQLRANLQVKSPDRVLSIGSAGCNCFNLLLDAPSELHIVDISPAQLALIRLKISAISQLSHDEFLQLLGYVSSPHRKQLFEKLSPFLPATDKTYWNTQSELIENGLCHQGRLEGFFKLFRQKFLHGIWDDSFRQKLIQCNSVESQIELVKNAPNKAEFERMGAEFFGRQGLEKGRDPAQMKYVTQENIGKRFFRLFWERLQETPVSQNFFLHYFIQGEFPQNREAWPSYLQEKNYLKLRGLLSRLHLHEADIAQVLDSQKSFSAFNLSDVFEYMSTEQTENMMQLLASHSTIEARLAYWTLLVDRPPMSSWTAAPARGFDRLWFYEDFYICKKQGLVIGSAK